jgi:hypothetical protein
MEQLYVIFLTEIGKETGAFRVDPVGQVHRILAPINVGNCGKIDKNVWLVSANNLLAHFFVENIPLFFRHGYDIELLREIRQDVRADETVAARDQYFQWNSFKNVNRQP